MTGACTDYQTLRRAIYNRTVVILRLILLASPTTKGTAAARAKTRSPSRRALARAHPAPRLKLGGKDDRERTRADDAGQGDRPVRKVTLVLVAIGLEVLRRPDRRVLVDVRLTVLQAELVHVARLAASPIARVAR